MTADDASGMILLLAKLNTSKTEVFLVLVHVVKPCIEVTRMCARESTRLQRRLGGMLHAVGGLRREGAAAVAEHARGGALAGHALQGGGPCLPLPTAVPCQRRCRMLHSTH